MSFSDELNSIKSSHTGFEQKKMGDSFEEKVRKEKNDVLNRLRRAAQSGETHTSITLYYSKEDYRDYYYEYFKQELKKPEYKFRDVKITKSNTDDYNITIYVSWLQKSSASSSNSSERITMTKLSDDYDDYIEKKKYKKERKKQFKEMHPFLNSLKTIFTIIIVIYLLCKCD